MKKTIHIKDQTHNPNFLTAHCMIAVRSNKNNLHRQRDIGGGGVKGGRGGEGVVHKFFHNSQPLNLIPKSLNIFYENVFKDFSRTLIYLFHDSKM